MYDEAGRLMRDNFWRRTWAASTGTASWTATGPSSTGSPPTTTWSTCCGRSRANSAPRTPTSHRAAAASGGDRRQGLLGADISRHEDGSWRDRPRPARRDVRPARPRHRSPRPGSPCARVTRSSRWTDGRSTRVTGPGPLLVGTAGKPVELTVSPGRRRRPRHAVVVPLADEEPLRYHAWVADRRAYVHEQSGGRLGYLHVPDMQAPGWAQIHRDLRVEVAREGLVVDVRENRGGHTSPARRREAGPADRRLGPAARHAALQLPAGRAARARGRGRQRVLRLGRRHRQRGDQGARDRPGRRRPHLGRRRRHRQPLPAGRRHAGDPAQVRASGWRVTGGAWRTTASTRTSRWSHAPQDYAAGRDPQLDEAVRIALAALEENPATRRLPRAAGGDAPGVGT